MRRVGLALSTGREYAGAGHVQVLGAENLLVGIHDREFRGIDYTNLPSSTTSKCGGYVESLRGAPSRGGFKLSVARGYRTRPRDAAGRGPGDPSA
jgi:hypothetical protein